MDWSIIEFSFSSFRHAGIVADSWVAAFGVECTPFSGESSGLGYSTRPSPFERCDLSGWNVSPPFAGGQVFCGSKKGCQASSRLDMLLVPFKPLCPSSTGVDRGDEDGSTST